MTTAGITTNAFWRPWLSWEAGWSRMLAKLALRNVRRSTRDFAIYFVTLVLCVCLFYAFGSISAQSVLFDLQAASDVDTWYLVDQMMSLFSVIVAFALIFLLVTVLNVVQVRKQKLITLLSPRLQGGRAEGRNPILCLVGFVASIAILVCAYVTLGDNGLFALDQEFAKATVLMVVGTALFFWSVAGGRLRRFFKESKGSTIGASRWLPCVRFRPAWTVRALP